MTHSFAPQISLADTVAPLLFDGFNKCFLPVVCHGKLTSPMLSLLSEEKSLIFESKNPP